MRARGKHLHCGRFTAQSAYQRTGLASRLVGTGSLVLFTLFTSGCWGLFNRQDATAPAKSASLTKSFANRLEDSTALSRGSGEVTRVRLQKLFPTAPSEDVKKILLEDDFSIAD